MIRTSDIPLTTDSINPYASISYISQTYLPITDNALRNYNFCVWQYFTEQETKEGISVSSITEKDGYCADCWFIDNLTSCAQSLIIKKTDCLFTPLRNVGYSIRLESGDQAKESTGLTTALSQKILKNKIANLINSNHLIGVSFYVRSSIVGKFCCAFTVYDYNNSKKHIKILSYNITKANETQKVTLWFGLFNFSDLYPSDIHLSYCQLDFILSGSSLSSDTSWSTTDISEGVIKCLNGQANLYTGENDYIEFSNIGIQSCENGYSMAPELIPVDYIKDFQESIKTFEVLKVSQLELKYDSSDEIYSYWTGTVKMESIKIDKSLIIEAQEYSTIISYKSIDGKSKTQEVTALSNFSCNDTVYITFTVTSTKIDSIVVSDGIIESIKLIVHPN